MKDSLSGSIINEIEVNERWEAQRKQALELLTKLKKLEIENPKRMIRVNKTTIQSENFEILMINRQIL